MLTDHGISDIHRVLCMIMAPILFPDEVSEEAKKWGMSMQDMYEFRGRGKHYGTIDQFKDRYWDTMGILNLTTMRSNDISEVRYSLNLNTYCTPFNSDQV